MFYDSYFYTYGKYDMDNLVKEERVYLMEDKMMEN